MKPFDMPFSEFAEAMKPSGAVNRIPSLGVGADVHSYSVYMNGPLAALLPADAQEHQYKDVMLHALTEKLQLNSGSARDNLKVAEVVAVRSAWMSSVLESTLDRPAGLSEQVLEDYALLTDGLTHPWIVGELDKQRALGAKLQPALDRAGMATGGKVKYVAPKENSVGEVVAQDDDFTMQKTGDGEVVTHENRRLNAKPVVGSEVVISYYRGSGQVINSLANVKVSPPFIDSVSGDLAVLLAEGARDQVVLFNSVSSFGNFVKAHGLDDKLVRQAMDARAASPKVVVPPPERVLASDVYVDAASGCLAVDYKERGVVYSALFRNADEMGVIADEFGLGAKEITAAGILEGQMADRPRVNAQEASEMSLRANVAGMGYEGIQEPVDGRLYIGKVIAVSGLHVAQDIGRRAAVIHDLRALDKVPAVGDNLTVKFDFGRGKVTDMGQKGKDLGR